jgi:solute carrier family 8 (sodium/calcium exchanger)
MLHPSKGEDGEIEDISGGEAVLHFLCIGWKLFYSFIPPAHYGGGFPCFVISLAFIGFTTFIIGEFADLFGCVLLIKPSVTAITFVALGTSLPDTFASMLAATQEDTADASVGNVTGSNSVNVFLGLGLPWVIATWWEETHDFAEKGYKSNTYFVPSESLGFSVVVFIFTAVLCIILLVVRRFVVGGELGGSSAGRIASASFLISLWLFYIIMCIIQAYGSKEF